MSNELSPVAASVSITAGELIGFYANQVSDALLLCHGLRCALRTAPPGYGDGPNDEDLATTCRTLLDLIASINYTPNSATLHLACGIPGFDEVPFAGMEDEEPYRD